jgi:hypothetical protein
MRIMIMVMFITCSTYYKAVRVGGGVDCVDG